MEKSGAKPSIHEFHMESATDSLTNSKLSSTKKIKARDNYGPHEGRRIYKNLLFLSFSFILLFTAFFSMSNLQTSLNSEEGLGQYALATIYLSMTISSLFVPSLMIRKLSCKWTIIVSMAGYMVYIAAQFHPTFGILIPAAVVIGLTAAPLWSAQSIYLKQIGEEYAYFTSMSKEVVLQRFFGLFSLLFVSAQIWGSLIAVVLFSSEEEIDLEEMDVTVCGANHCPAGHSSFSGLSQILAENSSLSDTNFLFGNETSLSPLSNKPDMTLVYWLAGIYLACSIAAAICSWIFLDSLERYGENERTEDATTESSAKDLALATVLLFKDPYQVLLMPLTIWTGLQGGFLAGDYNLGYISCAWGVKYIGYSMICFGITNGFSSIFFGRITRYTGRPAVFLFAGVISLSSIVTLFAWSPNPAEPAVFLLVSGMWGFAEGIWNPQITALYGTIFPDAPEAAFSNLRLWNSIGFIIGFVNGAKFCMETKLYFCIVVLIFSLACYLFLEVRLRRDGRLKAAESLRDMNEDEFTLPEKH